MAKADETKKEVPKPEEGKQAQPAVVKERTVVTLEDVLAAQKKQGKAV